MMNQSLMSLKRRTAVLPYSLCCAGGALTPARPVPPATSEPPPPLLPLVPKLKPLERRGWAEEATGGPSPPKQGAFRPEETLLNSQGELEEDEEEMMESGSCGPTSPPQSPTPPSDPLYQDTHQLLLRFFREYARGEAACKGLQLLSPAQRRALDTLHRVGGDIIVKHRMAYQGMLTKLSIQQAEDLQKLSEVPSLVFNDGITNWGRIVTLISFGAFLAKHLQSIKLEDCIVPLADSFTDYLMTSKREWIIQQKSWDGFVEFFHVEDYESGLRTVLMTFAGVAGIGASLAYMIR